MKKKLHKQQNNPQNINFIKQIKSFSTLKFINDLQSINKKAIGYLAIKRSFNSFIHSGFIIIEKLFSKQNNIYNIALYFPLKPSYFLPKPNSHHYLQYYIQYSIIRVLICILIRIIECDCTFKRLVLDLYAFSIVLYCTVLLYHTHILHYTGFLGIW